MSMTPVDSEDMTDAQVRLAIHYIDRIAMLPTRPRLSSERFALALSIVEANLSDGLVAADIGRADLRAVACYFRAAIARAKHWEYIA